MAEASTSAARGMKRKRPELTEDGLAAKIAGKLHHDLKEVRKAAKKAKVFESQKIVKKLKDLRRKDDPAPQIADLEAEFEVLKTIDHEHVANTATRTKLKKDHLLSRNEHVIAAISSELSANLLSPAGPGTPTAKVQSRLLSSKLLAMEVAAVVDDLKLVLQPERKQQATGDDAATADSEPRPKKRGQDTTDEGIQAPQKTRKPDLHGEVLDNDLEDGEDHEDGDVVSVEENASAWESGSVGGTEGWESGSVEADSEVEGSGSSGGEDSSTDDDPAAAPPSKKPKTTAPKPKAKDNPKSTTRTAQSTFLPSLSVGFTRGDSDDSEWSDSEAKIADGAEKKNRRGQRARRAIWEKKFGKNANHMKKQRETMEASGRGRGRRPGAMPSTRPTPEARPTHPPHKPVAAVQQHHQQADAGWGQRKNHDPNPSNFTAPRPAASVPPRARIETGLHPSWEAKRKLKEKQSAGILPAQGTKIKF
ncbi:hypothetical protein PLICRDRAFT_52558 [Plicaturopsis crispa FD-325 SS-3]|nr:hypothetical protein PLICRDRAFT_52558 [Plicaturopsis crispa FD-325 SS-3]